MPGGFPGAVTPDVIGARADEAEELFYPDERIAQQEEGHVYEGAQRSQVLSEEDYRAQSRATRESMASMRSDTSSALGGIGGLLRGQAHKGEMG